MPHADPAPLDDAARWVVRTRDTGFHDWDTFTQWLEADPHHNAAYELALDAHDDAALLAARPAVTVAAPAVAATTIAARRNWRPAWLTAAAAALAVAVVVPRLIPRQDTYQVATAPGEHRALRLADGTQIALNGDTALSLDRAHPRAVRLDRGQASFTVVHDDANPFIVTAGGARIEDVGTVFDVRRSENATDVGVAEGSVVYDPDGARVKLLAGGTLHDPDKGMIEVAQADPATIGVWRKGRLVYREAPLFMVAADLSRATGRRVIVAPQIASRAFSGTIQFRDVPQPQLFGRVGALTGTRAVRDGDGWHLSSGAGAPR